jgi:hypothetical protein
MILSLPSVETVHGPATAIFFSAIFIRNSNRQMASLHWLKFGGPACIGTNRLTRAIYRSK